MCGVYKPTNVISVSYGGQEADLPLSYQKRQCLEYMKLGLQGVSFLFASGDSGVSSTPFIPSPSLAHLGNTSQTTPTTSTDPPAV
jgi:subtilase family serine protease